MELNLQEIRENLDDIDSRIIELFSRRMRLVKDVAAYKKAHGLPILDAGREERILDRVSEKAGDELAPYARRVYETMFAVSREYQAERLKDGEQ
jgi:chorismate mutase/prephenate dehydratase